MKLQYKLEKEKNKIMQHFKNKFGSNMSSPEFKGNKPVPKEEDEIFAQYKQKALAKKDDSPYELAF
jgi:hypothetical protein